MKCEILWNVLSLPEWEDRFVTISHSNILQSYDYALAACRVNRQSARWGLIEIDGVEAGLVQILEARTGFGLFHAVILDRGPLWFDGFGSAPHVASFFKEFNAHFPKRWGRRRRIIPEIEQSETANKILQQNGLITSDNAPYTTLWWNISQKEEYLRKNLSKSWLKSLRKSENSDLVIEWDNKLKYLDEFKQNYAIDKQIKGYENISPKLLDNLASLPTRPAPIIIGKVMKNGEWIAGMLFLTHGSCATYQIGWTTKEGRKHCAHHALLWQAKFMYDAYNIKTLDLGGIKENDDGITKFKKGTGASPCTLIGQYS